MPDAFIQQTAPVSEQWYTVLDTTKRVRVISIGSQTSWAVTQPHPTEVLVTIDGKSILFVLPNPISYSAYTAVKLTNQENNGFSNTNYPRLSFLYEGRNVKVETRTTWAVNAPAWVRCRVKYGKWVT